MIHSYVDYPLRDPCLAFLWFTLAGALGRGGWAYERARLPEAF